MVTIRDIRATLSEITGELFVEEPPEILYHYTDHAGLVGIARSKEVCLGHRDGWTVLDCVHL